MLVRTVLVLLAITAPLHAAIDWKPSLKPEPTRSRYGDIRRVTKADPMVDLIVEFRESEVRSEASGVRSDAIRAKAEALAIDLDEPVAVERTFSRVMSGASVRVRRERIRDITKLPYVAKVHLARKFEVMSDSEAKVTRAIAARVRALGSGGSGVTVAVIDTGIDYTHPALGGGFGSGSKVIGGWDFVNDDADPVDDHGHGTHVAGIVAANGGGLLGVAPDASLVAYKVIARNGYGEEEDILAAIERAMDPDQNGDTSDHVDVVNMSLGAPASIDDPVANAVERAIAAGVVFAVSMGNTGLYGDVQTPAIAPSAISVGAASNDNKVAWWSTRGPSYDYGIKPEVVAPGVEIVSSVLNGKNGAASGTSMASPYVAGIAALVIAQHRDWTPAQVKAAIVTTSLALEEDVMVAGAGRAMPEAATAATTYALPVAVNFGQLDVKQTVWTTSRTVTLRNTTTTAQTLTAAVTGLRDGVSVSVTPNVVNLAPGESKTVDVALSVTNALVPTPLEGSLSFGGRVTWSGGASPVHVPWAFVKAGFLTIELTEGGIAYANVLSANRRYSTSDFLDRTRVLWPFESVDVVLSRFDLPMLVAVAEQVDVLNNPIARASLDAATLTVPMETIGEDGLPISSMNRECQERVVLSFPSGQRFGTVGSVGYRAQFAPLSSRVKLYPMHSCGDVATTTLYAAMHEPLQGLSTDVLSTSNPQWLQQDVQFTPEIGRDESMISALAVMRFPGTDTTYYWEGGSFFLMRGVSSKLRILFTKAPDAEVDLMALTDWWGRCWSPELGHLMDCPVIDNIFLYLNEHTVTVETDLYRDVSPMGYTQPRTEVLTLGRGPVSPQVRFVAGAGYWGMTAYWFGAMGERIFTNTFNTDVAVYDANGAVMGKGKVGLLGESGLTPGLYRLEAIDEQPITAGLRGKATYTAWSDTRRSDHLVPFFTGLRVDKANGRTAQIVDRNERATLVFAVTDMIRGRVFFERVPPVEEKTRVEYRAYGSQQWHPLPAVVSARHYPFSMYLNGGAGTVYRIDLGAVTSTLDGPVDLRIFAEDSAGNTAEVVLEPALWIGDPVRRRTVRH